MACPSGMIRLRSATDEKSGRLAVIATRPPFKVPLRTEPRVVLPSAGLTPVEPRVEEFRAERAGIEVHPSLFWDYDEGVFAALGASFAETITRHFRRASLDVRL